MVKMTSRWIGGIAGLAALAALGLLLLAPRPILSVVHTRWAVLDIAEDGTSVGLQVVLPGCPGNTDADSLLPPTIRYADELVSIQVDATFKSYTNRPIACMNSAERYVSLTVLLDEPVDGRRLVVGPLDTSPSIPFNISQ